MTKFEAENNRIYPGLVLGKPNLITFKKLASDVINDHWIYSMHWDKEDWIKDAITDCENRIFQTRKELSDLEKVLQELKEID